MCHTYFCEYIKPGKNKDWLYKTWKNTDINWKHQHDSLSFEKMVIYMFCYERADSSSVPAPLIIGTYTYSPLADYVGLEYHSPLEKKNPDSESKFMSWENQSPDELWHLNRKQEAFRETEEDPSAVSEKAKKEVNIAGFLILIIWMSKGKQYHYFESIEFGKGHESIIMLEKSKML